MVGGRGGGGSRSPKAKPWRRTDKPFTDWDALAFVIVGVRVEGRIGSLLARTAASLAVAAAMAIVVAGALEGGRAVVLPAADRALYAARFLLRRDEDEVAIPTAQHTRVGDPYRNVAHVDGRRSRGRG